jgi:hypothetical protein
MAKKKASSSRKSSGQALLKKHPNLVWLLPLLIILALLSLLMNHDHTLFQPNSQWGVYVPASNSATVNHVTITPMVTPTASPSGNWSY